MDHALKLKKNALQLLLAGTAALALSGCADSSRVDDPLSSPFHASARYDRAPTGAINAPPAEQKGDFFSETFKTFNESSPKSDSSVDLRPSTPPRPVPSLSVESQPLTPPAPISSSPLPAPRSQTPTPAYSSRPVPPAPVPAQAMSAAPRSVPARVGGWSLDGGAPVVVGEGESAGMIANRYGVPVDSLLKLNGYRTASQVQPGSRLTIPVYSASQAARVEAPAPRLAPAPQPQALKSPKAARATPKDDEAMVEPPKKAQPRFALKAGPKSLVEEESEPAAKAPVAAPAKPRIDAAAERKAKLAEARTAAIKEAAATIEKKKLDSAKAEKAQAQLAQAQTQAQAKAQAQSQAQSQFKPLPLQQAQAAPVAPVQAKPVAKLAEAAPEPAKPAQAKPQVASAPEEDATARTTPAGDSANPEFRWPARGRVIQAYGNSGNDGINIAVPEGTAVKAAESGVVTYAGSELKGYGNLVLIHHPNGFDSVYANNGSLNVKRGDTVKRGQTIALSGQSGNVASPQLHFELRKGHKPVDPTGFLAGL
jgi:murein DD-endopeptidase MepM/ murein hydrolase activator NlpD